LTLLIAFAVTACGYNLVGRSSNIPDDIRAIHIETLENGTQRPQVEQILTQALIDEMVTRRRFKVVNNEAEADAVLRGKVVSFRLRPVTFDASGLADSFEVEVTADMIFQRTPEAGQLPDDAEVVWQNSRYLFRQDYPVEQAGLDFIDRELQAITETSGRFAETLVIDILEGF
jgi:outer membrane lipopolysaccharide assembly protein LptE/RlpB